jgi:hypothetical protein
VGHGGLCSNIGAYVWTCSARLLTPAPLLFHPGHNRSQTFSLNAFTRTRLGQFLNPLECLLGKVTQHVHSSELRRGHSRRGLDLAVDHHRSTEVCLTKVYYISSTDSNTRYYCRYVLAGTLGAADHLMLTALVSSST